MMNIKSVEEGYSAELDSASKWCKDTYDSIFAPYFELQHELFNRMQSNQHPITDDELEHILIDVPIHLFEVSEELNAFRLKQEVIKMNIKKKKAELIKISSESTDTKRREDASLGVLEDELLVTSYGTVLTRVENEISFSRELIMGAKKIWDSRRSCDKVNPISEVSSEDLPAYRPNNSTYIHG